MSEHTPGPITAMERLAPSYGDHGWRLIASVGPSGKFGLYAPSAVVLQVEDGIVTSTRWDTEQNARRLAAAWNACQGIPTEVLEARSDGGPLWGLAEQLNAVAIQADLLAALQECVEDSQEAVNAYVATYGEHWRPHRLAALRETVSKARAAIARATGGKT